MFVFEYGLCHGDPGKGARLRLVVDEKGRVIVEEIDDRGQTSPRTRNTLAADELKELVALHEPNKLQSLGKSLGSGPAWARIEHPSTGDRTVTVLRHSTPEGVLDPSLVQGCAKASLPFFRIWLTLLERINESTSIDFRPPTIEKKRLALEGKLGKALLRFTETPADGQPLKWLKVFDTGSVEVHLEANEAYDGTVCATLKPFSSGRVAELFELVRRHVPQASVDALTVASWQVFTKNGRVQLHEVPVRKGAIVFDGKTGQKSAIEEAYAVFAKLLRNGS